VMIHSMSCVGVSIFEHFRTPMNFPRPRSGSCGGGCGSPGSIGALHRRIWTLREDIASAGISQGPYCNRSPAPPTPRAYGSVQGGSRSCANTLGTRRVERQSECERLHGSQSAEPVSSRTTDCLCERGKVTRTFRFRSSHYSASWPLPSRSIESEMCRVSGSPIVTLLVD
jgi:hypothetical protein